MSTSFSKHGVELLERIERVSAACAKGGGIGAKGAYFDMQDMFYRFTFDSIGEIAFGVSVGCLTKVCRGALCCRTIMKRKDMTPVPWGT